MLMPSVKSAVPKGVLHNNIPYPGDKLLLHKDSDCKQVRGDAVMYSRRRCSFGTTYSCGRNPNSLTNSFYVYFPDSGIIEGWNLGIQIFYDGLSKKIVRNSLPRGGDYEVITSIAESISGDLMEMDVVDFIFWVKCRIEYYAGLTSIFEHFNPWPTERSNPLRRIYSTNISNLLRERESFTLDRRRSILDCMRYMEKLMLKKLTAYDERTKIATLSALDYLKGFNWEKKKDIELINNSIDFYKKTTLNGKCQGITDA